MINKTAVILMNVGTPDEPTVKSVRRYLTVFLNDKRVIDLPWLARKLLVNLIIIPFRINKSTKLYKRLFTESGSPLLFHTESLVNKLEKVLGNGYLILTGMRYGNPGYKKALEEIKKEGIRKVIVVPLFPQHAMSTTETAFVAVEDEIRRQNLEADVIKVDQFYNHPGFIKAFAEKIMKYDPDSFDHILFSYHGLPNRQIEKAHPGITVEICDCSQSIPDHGKFCYRATCYATSRLIAKEAGIKPQDYSNAFQSRLSRNWLSPFSDEALLDKLKQGCKKILVVAPAFVTDCLETIIEIGEDYKIMFLENGGEELQLVESLNDSNIWVKALADIISSSEGTPYPKPGNND